MGSLQQISIGIVCLVAAFVFGNYVNNHQSGAHPNDVLDGDQVSAQPDGNVQSRLIDGVEFVEKRPASIATMRNRLEPRFSMPATDSTTALASGADPDLLPPPNQLDSKKADKNSLSKIDTSNPPSGSGLPTPSGALNDLELTKTPPQMAKASDVPDFSSIMDELEGTPIALRPLGKMPQKSAPLDNQTAHVIAKPRTGNANAPLKDLAREFSSPITPHENEKTPWNTEQQPEFSVDDFTPQLNDRSNHVVSREPIPPKSLVNNQDGDSSNHLARIQIDQDSANRVAHLNPSERVSTGQDTNVLNSRTDASTSPRSVQSRLPFSLNDQGKQQLAAIKSRATSQLSLKTTRFVDHVVQSNETLQSISKRYFGTPDYYLDIYLANRTKLRNPAKIQSGIALRIPIYE